MSVFILKKRGGCKGKERDHRDPNFSEGQDKTQLIFISRIFLVKAEAEPVSHLRQEVVLTPPQISGHRAKAVLP